MFDLKLVSSVALAGSALTIGYYIHKREMDTLLKATEEMKQTFIKEKNKIEETKDKVFEKLLVQEEKIKDMEEERKTTELKVLKMEKSLEEAESEEKRNVQVVAALKKERTEQRNRWGEETLQPIREKEGSDGQLEDTWTNQLSSFRCV